MTESGWRPIETIARDDKVLTHRSRLRRVIGVQSHAHVGRLRGLRVKNQSTLVWVTPEQRFLTPSPQAERGTGGEVGFPANPTPDPSPSPLAGRGEGRFVHRRLGGLSPRTTHLARELRSTATPAEELLWEELRGRRLNGAKFSRQHPIGANYIVDFYCAEFQLAIELDGGVHDSERSRWSDGIRQRQIQIAGVRVVRFENERIFADISGVLDEIRECLVMDSVADINPDLKWVRAELLEIGSLVAVDGFGQASEIEAIENRFVNQTVYDLTVEEDHSFITEIGAAHNDN